MIRWLKTLWPVLLFPIAAHADHIAISFGPSLDGGTNPSQLLFFIQMTGSRALGNSLCRG